MTDKRIATIREALEKAIDNLSYYDGFDFGQWEKALAALNSLASEPCTDARELEEKIREECTTWNGEYIEHRWEETNDQAAALIQSAFDKIRREKNAEIAALKAERDRLRHYLKASGCFDANEKPMEAKPERKYRFYSKDLDRYFDVERVYFAEDRFKILVYGHEIILDGIDQLEIIEAER